MTSFEQNITNIYGSRGQRWLRQLPSLITQVSQDWGLTNLKPVVPMTYNYVLAGFQKEKPIILKLSLDPKRLYQERTALK